jgi:hypothetical protein
MKFLSLTIIAVSLSSCSAFQIFGFNFGESETAVNNVIVEPATKIANDFSAGSGDSVCVAGDVKCEASASTPKLANADGIPRFIIC